MKIAMIDQDGVLLDRNYQTTADIQGFCQTLPEEIKIVPNSDTPIERIRNNFRIIGGLETSDIIGEKGAVVLHDGEVRFTSNIQNISDYLRNLKAVFGDVDCDIVVGDSATWIREAKRFTPSRRMLIIDGLRKQTVGFYLRTTDSHGVSCRDDQWFGVGTALIKKIPLPQGLEAEDFNVGYGIVIMNAAGVSKTDGYRLLRRFYPKATFYMIGDGDVDIIGDSEVIHCAVGNTSANFKKIARFVSDKEITAGLIDCLQWIAKQ